MQQFGERVCEQQASKQVKKDNSSCEPSRGSVLGTQDFATPYVHGVFH